MNALNPFSKFAVLLFFVYKCVPPRKTDFFGQLCTFFVQSAQMCTDERFFGTLFSQMCTNFVHICAEKIWQHWLT